MRAPFEIRPTCSCGVKMKLIEYSGYYDGFKYWACENCDLENQLDEYDSDEKYRGAYA